MRQMAGRTVGTALLALALTACAGSPAPSTGPAEPAPTQGPAPDEAAPSRPSISAEECQSKGGTVVGDIGDGATRRADYVCPSGGAPIGNVAPPAGGPIAIEGNVCCPK
jgi:hypothetical protein